MLKAGLTIRVALRISSQTSHPGSALVFVPGKGREPFGGKVTYVSTYLAYWHSFAVSSSWFMKVVLEDGEVNISDTAIKNSYFKEKTR